MIDIRVMTDGDLEALRSIAWETWVASYASFIPEADLRAYFDEHYTFQALQQLFRRPTVKGFLATADGEPAGFAKVEFNRKEGRFYLSSLYVLPSQQGKGIGGRLLRAAEECALGYGVDSVWLGVMVQNTDALAWYRKLGFQFVEEAPFTMGKTTVSHLIGYRRIPSAT